MKNEALDDGLYLIQRHIHLGVADKMWINNIVNEFDLDNIEDIGYTIRRHLIKAGYGSKYLKDYAKRRKQHDHGIANHVLERYGYPEIKSKE